MTQYENFHSLKQVKNITGCAPPFGMSTRVSREVIRDWICKKHKGHWQSTRGQRQAKGFLKRPSPKGAK
jgi:hypothetical protein